MKYILILIIISSGFILSSCGNRSEDKKLTPREAPANIDSQTATNTGGTRP